MNRPLSYRRLNRKRVSVMTTLLILLFCSSAVHRLGSHKFIEARAWFGFLDEHHYIHHVDTEANVNFLLPLADWLFGTLRGTLTAEELKLHGSRLMAKSQVIGAGEPARKEEYINCY